MAERSKIQGHGINDADYPYRLQSLIEGKYKIVWQCPIHSTWKDLMRRCFSEKLKEKCPCYKDVTVCEDWLLFSNFKAWVDSHESLYDVDGKLMQVDKDLKVVGNKHYSPENCLFISRKVNNFLLTGGKVSKCGSRGVSYHSKREVYQVFCSDPLNRFSKFIGDFYEIKEAERCYIDTKKSYLSDLFAHGYMSGDIYKILLDNWFDSEDTYDR
jgi:hypothetical protein